MRQPPPSPTPPTSAATGACLDLELLAAYVDHRTTPEQTATVEAHLVRCERCYELFAVGMETAQPEVIPFRRSQTLKRWAAPMMLGGATAAALFIALHLGAGALPPFGASARLQQALRELDQTIGNHRLIAPRLTSDLAYHPLAPMKRTPLSAEALPAEIELAAAKVKLLAHERGSTLESQRALATMHLLLGQAASAVAVLEPLASASDDAGLLSEAAAAYLVRQEPGDAVRALDLLERAVVADANLPQAWFNLALAAEALGLRDRAEEAWRRYLDLDSSSPWAGEARQHLQQLEAPTRAMRWQEEQSVFKDALAQLDRDLVEPFIRTFGEEILRYFDDDLVPSWGAAHLEGRTADADATLARTVFLGTLLSKLTDDQLPADVAAWLQRATDQSSATLQARMAAGVTGFAEARRLYADDRHIEAAPEFQRAASELSALQSPLLPWTQYYVALTDYLNGRLAAAADHLTGTIAVTKRERYLTIEGRCHWLTGMVRLGQVRLPESSSEYLEALDLFARVGHPENTAAVNALVATNYDNLGDSRAGWEYRVRAFHAAGELPVGRRRHTILRSGIQAALDQEQTWAALRLQHIGLDNATAWNRDGAIVEALLGRARIQSVLDRRADALTDLTTARQALARIPDPLVRSRIGAELPPVEAEVQATQEPAAAIEAVTRAIEKQEWAGLGFTKASLLHTRGQCISPSAT